MTIESGPRGPEENAPEETGEMIDKPLPTPEEIEGPEGHSFNKDRPGKKEKPSKVKNSKKRSSKPDIDIAAGQDADGAAGVY